MTVETPRMIACDVGTKGSEDKIVKTRRRPDR
jgi:hypothetical protein